MKIKLVLGLILFLLVANCIRLYILQSEKYLNLTCESTVHFTDNSHGKDFYLMEQLYLILRSPEMGIFILVAQQGINLKSMIFHAISNLSINMRNRIDIV